MRRRHIVGFTLIEVLATLAILVMTGAAAIRSMSGSIDRVAVIRLIAELRLLDQMARLEAQRGTMITIACDGPNRLIAASTGESFFRVIEAPPCVALRMEPGAVAIDQRGRSADYAIVVRSRSGAVVERLCFRGLTGSSLRKVDDR